MKRWGTILIAAYLTIGTNHNVQLGNGRSVEFAIEQPLDEGLSLNPTWSLDHNDGFDDKAANVDLAWEATKQVTFIMGAGYDKYELTGVSPTEDTNVHTALKFKVW